MKFHHIGVATKNIDKEFSYFEMLGYRKISVEFVDSIQKIKGVFVEAENQPVLELLENIEAQGPLDACLKAGIKFYHFAYETENIEKDLEYFVKEKKAKIIVPITKATYFEKICFVMLRNMMIIELVQINK